MPNHVVTVIRAPHRVIEALKSDESPVDFRKIIEPPANMETDGCSGQHDPGVVCWYEWQIANWGTKWNAYDIETDDKKLETMTLDGTVATLHASMSTVKFETAWSHPEPIMRTLSKMFPTDQMEVLYADEDLGYNYGMYSMLDGVIMLGGAQPFGPGTDAARDLASYLHYGKSYAELRKEWGEDDDDDE